MNARLQKQRPLNIVIVGRGSIGSLLATKLGNCHYISFYFPDSPRLETSFTLTHLSGGSQYFKFKIATERDLCQADFIISCVKSYQVADALMPIANVLKQNKSHVPIILCHNGMGTDSSVQEMLPSSTSLFALLTTHGCFKKDTNHFVHTGKGRFDIGAISPVKRGYDDRANKYNQTVKQQLVCPTVDFFWQDNIAKQQWQKLAVNCAINPLTAIHKIKNGALVAAQYQASIKAIIEEVSLVASGNGINLTVESLLDTVYQVIKNTANNYSSMHQDIAYNRRTEIDFISGFIVERGKLLRISTPVNEEMLTRVKEKQSKA